MSLITLSLSWFCPARKLDSFVGRRRLSISLCLASLTDFIKNLLLEEVDILLYGRQTKHDFTAYIKPAKLSSQLDNYHHDFFTFCNVSDD